MPTSVAAKKTAPKKAPPKKTDRDYRYYGTFNSKTFLEEFHRAFAKRGMGANANDDVLVLLGMMERDIEIYDIRWMAYMLATVLKETTHPETAEVRVLDKKGQPVLDKNGQPKTREVRNWVVTMNPVAEVGFGKGRRYHEPVKVFKLEDGTARITEQDGDQFSINASGVVKPLKKGAVMGTDDGGKAVKAYDDDPGTPLAYYGRGYVQLTWWSNYAKAGVAIGKGLDLLFDPELVCQPETAYAIMSHGMRTGFGFANGRRFSTYFSGGKANYVGARAMVNGSDSAQEIAKMAQAFEAALFASRRVLPIWEDSLLDQPLLLEPLR